MLHCLVSIRFVKQRQNIIRVSDVIKHWMDGLMFILIGQQEMSEQASFSMYVTLY